MPFLPSTLDEIPDRLLPLEEDSTREESRRRRAAVLLLLYPRAGIVYFPLTVRPGHLARHAGQISLPGGLVEDRDPTFWDAAVRETEEELGIDAATIRPLGRLTTYHLTVTDYLVTPFVGRTAVEPSIAPDPSEVAEVFTVSVDSVLDEATVEQEEWQLRGSRWLVTFYRLQGKVVWGATARILHDFASRVAGCSLEGPGGPGSVLPLD
jgi:8-oxo-dGTP pyrophosphatase MutT (NUDIX family)